MKKKIIKKLNKIVDDGAIREMQFRFHRECFDEGNELTPGRFLRVIIEEMIKSNNSKL